MTEEQVREIFKQELGKALSELYGINRYTFQKNIQIFDARNIHLGKTIGTQIGTETTQKLGFYGKTPVIQQTTSSQTAAAFTANSSGISDDTATWGGYTVGDLVAILKVLGLIA